MAAGIVTAGGRGTDPPNARYGSSMTYDAKDGYVVLFGGTNNTTAFSDTWEFIGGTWTPLKPTLHPSARFFASMTYDAKDGYAVLFGGVGPNSTGRLHALSDTWKFVGGQWTSLTASTHPTPRFEAGIAYDGADQYVLLFGGANLSIPAFSDTWTFVAGAWTKLPLTTHPSARFGGWLAYDASDHYVVLFGGCCSKVGLDSDSWTFASGSWSKLSVSTHPSARIADVLTYDAADGYVMLFGGQNSTTNPAAFHDTWSFLHGAWTKLSPTVHPSQRYDSGFAYDSKDGYVTVFGGVTTPSYAVLSDSWWYYSTAWGSHAPLDTVFLLGVVSASSLGGFFYYKAPVVDALGVLELRNLAFLVKNSTGVKVVPLFLNVLNTSGGVIGSWNFTPNKWVSGNLSIKLNSTYTFELVSNFSLAGGTLVSIGKGWYTGSVNTSL